MKEHQIFEERMGVLAIRNGGKIKMASDIGVHPNTLYRVGKTNNTYPSANVLITIAKKYGVSVDWLLGLSEKEELNEK